MGGQHLSGAMDFKNPDKGRGIIERLIEIERLSPSVFTRVENFILGVHTGTKDLYGKTY